MANPLLGEVAFPGVQVPGFENGGTVVVDFNALATLEGELQNSIETLGLDVLQSPTVMRTVFRVALEEHHGAVDDRTAGKIIQQLGTEVAAEAVAKSFALCFPEAAKAGNGNPPRGAKKSAPGTSRSARASGSK